MLLLWSHVTYRLKRVFGDHNNRAHRSRNCDTGIRLSCGSAAGGEPNVSDPLEGLPDVDEMIAFSLIGRLELAAGDAKRIQKIMESIARFLIHPV